MAKFVFTINLIILFYFAGKLDFSSGDKPGSPAIADVTSYGPYYIVSRSIDECTSTGPRDTENEVTHTLKVSKLDRIQEVFSGIILVPNDLANVSISVSNEVWSDGGYKPFFYKMYHKPCEQRAIIYFLNNLFNGQKTCAVKKGNYTVENVSPTVIMKEILGTNFFYKKMSMIIAAYTKKGRIVCSRFLYETKPLPKKAQINRSNNKRTA